MTIPLSMCPNCEAPPPTFETKTGYAQDGSKVKNYLCQNCGWSDTEVGPGIKICPACGTPMKQSGAVYTCLEPTCGNVIVELTDTEAKALADMPVASVAMPYRAGELAGVQLAAGDVAAMLQKFFQNVEITKSETALTVAFSLPSLSAFQALVAEFRAEYMKTQPHYEKQLLFPSGYRELWLKEGEVRITAWKAAQQPAAADTTAAAAPKSSTAPAPAATSSSNTRLWLLGGVGLVLVILLVKG